MRKPLLFFALSVIVVAASSGFVGCTSLLGDFEVSTSPSNVDEGGTDAPTCTPCSNGQCVDTTSDGLNCGGCGIVCPGGQTCQASACKCPVDKAFCGGQCVVADRQHCGGTCAMCQSDEVCSSGCVAAPVPTFETTPLPTTGWLDPAGAPIKFKLKDTGIPGVIYECRTGPDATFSPTDPPWKPCDGAMGTTPIHTPKENPTTKDGTYRTEYRYRSDTYRSATTAFVFYVLHKLDKVPTCPRPGMDDGPHFTDQQYFQAAQAFSANSGGTFPLADAFPVPGNQPADPFFLRNPFIKIPFSAVRTVPAMTAGGWPAPPAVFDHVVKELSVRHTFTLNPTRTVMVIKRQYLNFVKRDCSNNFDIGSRRSSGFGPDDLKRGPRTYNCDALVINVHGQALCMGKNMAGNAPAPQKIDTQVHTESAQAGATFTMSGTGGSTLLTFANGSPAFLAGRWVFVPPHLHWYKVSAVAGQAVTLATPLQGAVPAGTSGWRYSNTQAKDVFILPTGYAHLYQDGKNAVARGPEFIPSFRTKCITPGCDKEGAIPTGADKPWMTFLPP